MNEQRLERHRDRLVLAALQSRPAHGYAIADTLRARGDGASDVPEGTLYPVLHRLERAGLVSSRWREGNGRRRRVYQLTANGYGALAPAEEHLRARVKSGHPQDHAPRRYSSRTRIAMTIRTAIVSLAFLIATVVSAQSVPNFSGRWV